MSHTAYGVPGIGEALRELSHQLNRYVLMAAVVEELQHKWIGAEFDKCKQDIRLTQRDRFSPEGALFGIGTSEGCQIKTTKGWKSLGAHPVRSADLEQRWTV
jgi:hypothetical protein